jgi:hypothetical protein
LIAIAGGSAASSFRRKLARTVSFLDAGVDCAGQKVDAGQQAQRSEPDIFRIGLRDCGRLQSFG